MISWTRADLKLRAKESVNRNYWWFVLACIILSLVGGTGSGTSASISTNSSHRNDTSSYSDIDDYFEDDNSYSYSNSSISAGILLGVSFLVIIIIMIVLVVMAIAMALSAFIFSPIRVGINRFFMNSREGRRDLNDIIFVFNCGHYLNVVKIMFITNLKIFLWSLLFIIPGMVKSYEYRMIPYILSENPGIDCKRVFQMTKAMTDGEKASIWVLDLSFI